METAEKVNHPAHYGGDTTYEAIKVIHAWGLGFNDGNAPSISAAPLIPTEKKAVWYLQDEIKSSEKEKV